MILRQVNTISDKCPFHKCNGDGLVGYIFLENGEEVERWGNCECLGVQNQPKIRKQAKIPLEFKDCTVNGFDTSLYQDQVTAKAAKKAAGNFVLKFISFKQQGKGLYLYSKKKGSGKTRLACSIANALIQTQSIQVKFLRTLDLLDMIKDTYKKIVVYPKKKSLIVSNNVKCLYWTILEQKSLQNGYVVYF